MASSTTMKITKEMNTTIFSSIMDRSMLLSFRNCSEARDVSSDSTTAVLFGLWKLRASPLALSDPGRSMPRLLLPRVMPRPPAGDCEGGAGTLLPPALLLHSASATL
jgi:hypothetical protein